MYICMYISMDIPSLIIHSVHDIYVNLLCIFEYTYRMCMCGVCVYIYVPVRVCVFARIASSVFWVKFKLVIKKSTNLSQPCVPV